MSPTLINFKKELTHLYDEREIQALYFGMMNRILHRDKTYLLVHQQDLEMDEEEMRIYENSVSRLKKSEPVQYIFNDSEFFGLHFYVDSNVLIPRPETEELIEWILQENQISNILDIGTGSGCIAISLKKNRPDANVHALDISEEAIRIAQRNASTNQVDVRFRIDDILRPAENHATFDVIVSNPPYITEKEKHTMHKNVLDYEPHLALFVSDEDPLLYYRKISEFAHNHLCENGKLFFETNEKFAVETANMLKENGFDEVIVKKDINGKNRMIRCRKK